MSSAPSPGAASLLAVGISRQRRVYVGSRSLRSLGQEDGVAALPAPSTQEGSAGMETISQHRLRRAQNHRITES